MNMYNFEFRDLFSSYIKVQKLLLARCMEWRKYCHHDKNYDANLS